MRYRKLLTLNSGPIAAWLIAVFLSTGNADAAAPSVTTLPASDVTTTSATLNGIVNPNEETTAAYFQYGLDTDYPTSTLVTNLPAGCPKCSREMRIISLIDDRQVIKRIIEHLGLWEEGIRVTTGTDPPGQTIVEPWTNDPFPDYDTEPVMYVNS